MEHMEQTMAILLNKILRWFDSHICACRGHHVCERVCVYRWQPKSATANRLPNNNNNRRHHWRGRRLMCSISLSPVHVWSESLLNNGRTIQTTPIIVCRNPSFAVKKSTIKGRESGSGRGWERKNTHTSHTEYCPNMKTKTHKKAATFVFRINDGTSVGPCCVQKTRLTHECECIHLFRRWRPSMRRARVCRLHCTYGESDYSRLNL